MNINRRRFLGLTAALAVPSLLPSRPSAQEANAMEWYNYFDNGNFDLWRRGSNFPNLTAPAKIIADRFRLSCGSNYISASRQDFALGQTDVPGNPKHYMRLQRVTAGSIFAGFGQIIPDVTTLAGEEATWTFWARASAAETLQVQMRQQFGTGGSPSPEVLSATQDLDLTTGWQKFSFLFDIPSIAGKSMGTNEGTDILQFRVRWEPEDLPTGTIEFARMSLLKGDWRDHPDPFPEVSLAETWARCNRCYRKSYLPEIAPVTSTSDGMIFATDRAASATKTYGTKVQFDMPMRTVPVVTIYPRDGAPVGSGQYNVVSAGSNEAPLETFAVTPNGFGVFFNDTVSGLAAGDAVTVAYHYTADCEPTVY